MTRYVALLRAINVGGRVVKMDRLRRLLDELRLSRVETFIASGNVVFESASRDPRRLEGRISRHLQKRLGYEVATFVRTPAEILEIARYRPFRDIPAAGALYIGFFAKRFDGRAGRIVRGLTTDTDEFRVRGRELYWLCRVRSMETIMSGPRLEKALRVPGTFRNANTIRRLAARYPPAKGEGA